MSADLMLVSSKQNQNFKNNFEQCICIDETSMGNPHTDFGRMVVSNTGFLGDSITDDFILKVKEWYKKLEHKEYIDIKKIVKWLNSHKGEPLEWECW